VRGGGAMTSRCPRRVAGLVVAEAAGAWVVRQPARGRVHYLNAAAALALELCTGDNEWPAIIDLVCAATGAPAGARAEVERVLQAALDEGLIVDGTAP